MFIYLTTILAVLGAAEPRIIISSSSDAGTSELCISSSTKAEDSGKWWQIVDNTLQNKEKFCRSSINGNETLTSDIMAKETASRIAGASDYGFIQCEDRVKSQIIKMVNDGKPDVSPAAVIRCDTGEIIRLFSHMNGDEFDKEQNDLEKELKKKHDDYIKTLIDGHEKEIELMKAGFERELAKAKEGQKTKDVFERKKLIEEHESSLDILRAATRKQLQEKEKKINDLNYAKAAVSQELEVLRNRIVAIEAGSQAAQGEKEGLLSIIEDHKRQYDLLFQETELESKNLKLMKEEVARLDHELKRERETVSRLRKELDERTNEIRKPKPHVSVEVKPVSEVILPLVTLMTSLIAGTDAETNWNKCPHVWNRPRIGIYSARGILDTNCLPVKYDGKCIGFKYLTNTDRFPFFNAHMHQLSIIEATSDIALGYSGDTYCVINGTNTKKAGCHSELVKLNRKCPNGISGVHYLDAKGKVGGLACPEEHEITEDCMYCRKLKNKMPVQKISASLQDAVCQRGSSDYAGPVPVLKGICRIGVNKYKECRKSATSYETTPFIIFGNKGKIYLNRLQLRNTEEMSPESFLCYEHHGLHGSKTTEMDTRLLAKVNVTDCKSLDSSKSKICTGDSTFCSQYKCEQGFSDTYCIVAPGAGPLEVMIAGAWVKPMCVGYERVEVEKELPSPIITTESECVTCVILCEDDGIVIRSTGFKIMSAVACSHGSCVSVSQNPKTDVKVSYPGISASIGGEIGIHLSHDAESVSAHVVAKCPSRDACSTHNCMLCPQGVINYQCHTLATGLMTATMVTMLICMFVFIGVKLIKIIRHVPHCIVTPVKWICLLFCWIAHKVKHWVHGNVENVNREIGWNQGQDQVVAPREMGRLRPPLRFSGYMALLFLVTGVMSCSETEIASSKISKCSLRDGKTTCILSGSVLLKAGPIGSESCLIIKGVTDDQKHFINIKTVASEMICREGNSFWTAHYSPHCISSRRCHLVAECHGNTCLAWNDTIVSAEFSGMVNNNVMRENKCFEQCGGIGCGCFNVNPSCLFVHTELKSARPEAFKVFNCIDWVHKVKLEITSPSMNMPKVVQLSDMNTQLVEWGTISLALDAEGITGSNSFSFMRSSKGGVAIIDEAYSDIPRKGFIGEIRCSSEAHALAAHESCLRAPNIISYKPMTDSVDCNTNLVDPVTLFFRGALPQTRNGKTFSTSIDKTSVQALASGVVKAQISLVFDNYEVSFKEDVVVCEASFINITGCYSCNEGARICVKVKSSGKGTFYLSAGDDLISMIGGVQAGVSDFCRMVHLSRPSINFDGSYHCSGEPRPITIKGTLVALNPFDDRKREGETSTIINPKAGSWSLGDWAVGFSDWMGGPLKAIGMVALYLILGLLLMVIVMFVIRALLSAGLSRFKKSN